MARDDEQARSQDDGEGAVHAEASEAEAEVVAGAQDLLDLVLAAHEARAAEATPARIDGVVIGRLVAVDGEGQPVVHYRGCPSPEGIRARAMAALGEADVGREAALLFEGGAPDRPVVMGLMHQGAAAAPARDGAEASVDGGRVVLSAEKEIVLQCGDASITLTRAGKILIRGAYVLTRSSGVNRIQGGSVEIN